MLEGKEVDVKFDGDAGEFSVDVDMTGKIEVVVSYKKAIDANLSVTASNVVDLDLIILLRSLESKLNNQLYTEAIETIAKLLGR